MELIAKNSMNNISLKYIVMRPAITSATFKPHLNQLTLLNKNKGCKQ